MMNTMSLPVFNQSSSADTVVIIREELGLHARPAARLARLAQSFTAEISLELDGTEADAKSILDILSLAASKGSSLRVHCHGEDAPEAITALEQFFSGSFVEE